MNKLCHNLAVKVCSGLNLDDERRQVIEYGLLGIVQMAVILICCIIPGLIFDFAWECIIIFFGVGLMRRCTGGAHASTLIGCTVMSILLICAMSCLDRYVLINVNNKYVIMAVIAICSVLSFIAIYLKAPVDSPNKPITKPEKIKRLRKNSFIMLIIYIIIGTVFFFFMGGRGISLGYSINCALMWQMFTLTRPGALLINTADKLFICSK